MFPRACARGGERKLLARGEAESVTGPRRFRIEQRGVRNISLYTRSL